MNEFALARVATALSRPTLAAPLTAQDILTRRSGSRCRLKNTGNTVNYRANTATFNAEGSSLMLGDRRA